MSTSPFAREMPPQGERNTGYEDLQIGLNPKDSDDLTQRDATPSGTATVPHKRVPAAEETLEDTWEVADIPEPSPWLGDWDDLEPEQPIRENEANSRTAKLKRLVAKNLGNRGIDSERIFEKAKHTMNEARSQLFNVYRDVASDNVQQKVTRVYGQAMKAREKYGPTVKKSARQVASFAVSPTEEIRRITKIKAEKFYEENRSKLLIGAASVVGAIVLGKTAKRMIKKSRE